MEKRLNRVLQAYPIEPTSIHQITDNLFQIIVHQHSFALKKSKLDQSTVSYWEYTYRTAYNNQLQSIIPVYQTKQNQLYYQEGEDIYYLCPWVEEERTSIDEGSIRALYQAIATIHEKTKRSQNMAGKEWSNDFKVYLSYCEDLEQQLRSTIILYEKRHYMSPFELLVCTQFRDVEYALREIRKRLDQFTKEDEKRETWNVSLCHRNLSTEHLRGSYIINWENAGYENAIIDLVSFFRHEVRLFDAPKNSFLENFSYYNNLHPLTLAEVQLLAVYLLNPIPYFELINEYRSKEPRTEISFIKELQKAYRVILFGIEWSQYVEREYEIVKFDEPEEGLD
ncbi:hypothetical protein D8M04_01370 [Oceanobacillus piezotolerans]|uniref:Spore coat protein YsxE n=1 Tax=Oceanobacillus piezotolerans TaxID=2448030 RepID=A0A498DEJ8_9BACI|nr:hypothetical protein [Oceanobacillus piezotolerans]RLL47955.1 hypothetical protein D8M04_01370 [Oceanobacillus piezotolerans]